MALLLEIGSLFILVHWVSGDACLNQASTITPSQEDRVGHHRDLPSTILHSQKAPVLDFPGALVVKNSPANAEDTGSIPVPGRSHMPEGN